MFQKAKKTVPATCPKENTNVLTWSYHQWLLHESQANLLFLGHLVWNDDFNRKLDTIHCLCLSLIWSFFPIKNSQVLSPPQVTFHFDIKAVKRDHFLMENRVLIFFYPSSIQYVCRTKCNVLKRLLLLIFMIRSAFFFHL